MTITSGSVLCFCLPGNSTIPLEEGWLDGFCGKGSSLLPVNIMGYCKVTTSGGYQDSGICLSQLLDTSLAWLESQCSLCPRLMDMAAVFLLQVQPIARLSMYSRDPLRDRGNIYVASLKYKKSSSPSYYPLLSSCQMINL